MGDTMKSKFKSTIPFGIIGLGRFGFALADRLADAHKEILVIDKDEAKIKKLQGKVSDVFVLHELDKVSLEETGIQNCDTVIVCIGEDVQASIITTLNVIELGVPRVIAKAVTTEHGRVLEKIGAEVIFPERDRAIRLAQLLVNSRALESIQLSDEFSVSQFKLNSYFANKTVLDLDLRNHFGLNIIAMCTDGKSTVEINADYRFRLNDIIVVAGRKENVQEFDAFLQHQD